MGRNDHFVEKKKLIGNDQFDDHHLEFCHDNDQSLLSKFDDEDDPKKHRILWESQQFLLQSKYYYIPKDITPISILLSHRSSVKVLKLEENASKEILDQCSSNGSKLRDQIKSIMEIVKTSYFCSCTDKNLRGCNKCLRQATINHLCSKGFNATLCTSTWKKTHRIPGGTHEYIEVVAFTQMRRKQVTFVVELGFGDEFRVAKACDEYHKLIGMLPEIYVGKVEHLEAIIRVVCEAAKKSAEEKKIHMGPWRRRDFMLMKWSASS